MNINRDIKITLNSDEQEAVRKVAKIVDEFVDRSLCKNLDCRDCLLAIFCPCENGIDDFEKTLNDIANMK